MQGEVDGGEGCLQGGELRTREGTVGDYAVDEGLVDRAAEESAIASRMIESVRVAGKERTGRPDDVVRGEAVED